MEVRVGIRVETKASRVWASKNLTLFAIKVLSGLASYSSLLELTVLDKIYF